jgi:hypothetical protein
MVCCPIWSIISNLDRKGGRFPGALAGDDKKSLWTTSGRIATDWIGVCLRYEKYGEFRDNLGVPDDRKIGKTICATASGAFDRPNRVKADFRDAIVPAFAAN